ncbi:MAG: class I SAM-dependent methyltransferase [Ilumatobacteraceae bacterium]
MATPVPPANFRFMGESEERYVQLGDEMVARIGTVVDLAACRRVVDIGCGYGRIGAAFLRSGFAGRYDGFDMLRPHLEWCNAHLGNRRFRYHYMDIHSERYNPSGTLQQTDVRFDVPAGTADLVVLTSVFTHMYPDDIVHYLHECRRLVSPKGRVYATFFVLDDVQASRRNHYELPHELTPFCRYMSPDEPLHVIGYTQEWLREQFAATGFRLDGEVRHGAWSGEPDAFDFQDTVVLAPEGAGPSDAGRTRWWRR